jgi:hypothetical protein
MMVHSPWGLCVGNADDMAKMAADLAHEGKNLAAIYAGKAGGTVDDWHAVMAAETWFSAEEAVAAGLADRVDEASTDDKPKARFDLSVFAYAGRQKAPPPCVCATRSSARGMQHQDGCPVPFAGAPAPQAPVSTAGGSVPQEGGSAVAFSDEQITALRQRLGVADDADEPPSWPRSTRRSTSTPTPTSPRSPRATSSSPRPVCVTSRPVSAAGMQAAKKMHAQEREAFLDSVRTKFAPANRAAWEAEYDRDPAGTRAHFEKAPEIVALTAIGHDDNPELSALDADYARCSATTRRR